MDERERVRNGGSIFNLILGGKEKLRSAVTHTKAEAREREGEIATAKSCVKKPIFRSLSPEMPLKLNLTQGSARWQGVLFFSGSGDKLQQVRPETNDRTTTTTTAAAVTSYSNKYSNSNTANWQ